MTDVFVSYARSTEAQARQIAEALRAQGYEVWRDDELPAHRPYGDVIEERLRSAKAVLAVWSVEAAKSQWVRAEADAAREAGTLVQVSVDGTLPPMPFNQIQCADLRGWKGNAEAAGWRKVEGSIAALVRGAGPTKREGPATAMRERRKAICVLPFVNMSGDAEQEYFSDGISEDITTDLSKVSALSVIARNTAFQFKGQSVDVSDIAGKLGVSHILEGSVRKAGNRVRITAQLIDGASGDHVWAERYDRDLDDIFAIQDEISKAIVATLRVKLLPDEEKAIASHGTTSAEAYNLFQMARQYWVTGNYGDTRRDDRVIRICRRAVEIDPEYARAWSLMALAQSHLFLYFGKHEENGLAAAECALALDPNIAEAHCVKARQLADEGKTTQADDEMAIALQLDPESWEVNSEAGRQAIINRRIEDASRFFEKAAALMDSDFHSWGILMTCYRKLGESEKVQSAARNLLDRCEAALRDDPSNGSALGMYAAGLAYMGAGDRAKEWIERALLLDPENPTSRYNFACVLANELRDYDAAIDLIETAFQQMGGDLIEYAEADPDLDSIRDNPRFRKALADARHRRDAAKLAVSPRPASVEPPRS